MKWESESNYLAHHGIKGQKWGTRRFQNEDGSLTPEGQERYGGKTDRGDKGVIKKWTLGSEHGNYAFAKWRERRHTKHINESNKAKSDIDKQRDDIKKQVASGEKSKEWGEKANSDLDRREQAENKKLEKYQSKLDAQSAANANLDAYRRHSSTTKLIAQNLAMPIISSKFRHARARGTSVLGSIVESAPVVGTILRMHRDKKTYGKYIVFGNMDGEEL